MTAVDSRTDVSAAPPPVAADRIAGLKRMKRLATSLLLAMTVVFVVARLFEDEAGWIGYVRATAEAGMVGALADWFAVTALFRHPLGIPIPHTAIIPTRKDEIGRGLGAFVQGNFLSADVIAEKVRSAGVACQVGEWLADPANATKLGESAGDVVRAAGEVLRDDEIQDAIEAQLWARVRAVPAAPTAGRILDVALDGGHHQRLLDVLLAAADRRRQQDGLESVFTRQGSYGFTFKVETGGAAHNRRFVLPALTLGDGVAPELVTLAHDPQTSGGLLAAVPRSAVKDLHAALEDAGIRHWPVGRVEASPTPGVSLA